MPMLSSLASSLSLSVALLPVLAGLWVFVVIVDLVNDRRTRRRLAELEEDRDKIADWFNQLGEAETELRKVPESVQSMTDVLEDLRKRTEDVEKFRDQVVNIARDLTTAGPLAVANAARLFGVCKPMDSAAHEQLLKRLSTFRREPISVFEKTPDRGPCPVCGKPVCQAYPWWNKNPTAPDARPVHFDCLPGLGEDAPVTHAADA